jgi:hypothetical protein
MTFANLLPLQNLLMVAPTTAVKKNIKCRLINSANNEKK